MKCICSKSIIVLGFLGLKSPVVAFTAKLSKDTTIASRVAVKYDHVVTNLGGAYQPSTVIFTAPYDGLYSISCTLMSDKSNTVYLEMGKMEKDFPWCALRLTRIRSLPRLSILF